MITKHNESMRHGVALLAKSVDSMLRVNIKHALRMKDNGTKTPYQTGFCFGREIVLSLIRDDIKNILSRDYDNEKLLSKD